MALINCPECGKEISDKASSCPHCGCPLSLDNDVKKDSNSESLIQNNESLKKTGIIQKKTIFISVAAVVLLIFVVGIVVANKGKGKDDKKNETVVNKETVGSDEKKYNEAMESLNKGDYENANKLLEEIPDYEGVKELQDQIYYESRVCKGLIAVKDILKSPDSLQFYDCEFFNNSVSTMKRRLNKDNDSGYYNSLIQAMFKNYPDEPLLVLYFGAQNSMGGNTEGYAVLYSNGDGYECAGTCRYLDENKKDSSDGLTIRKIINYAKEYYDKVKNVDVDKERIKNILKDSNYSTVKVIK